MVFVAVMVTLAAVGTSAQRVCDGAEIASDADAEAFAGCTSVTGTVTLTGSLSATGMALLNFTTAEEVSITGLTQLESLAGLALTAVTGSVRVASNPVLFSLDGLQALASVAGDLSIRDNAKLVDSIALTKALASVGGSLEVVDNPLLCNIRVGTTELEVVGTTTLDISCLPLTISMSVLAGFVALTLATCALVEVRRRRAATPYKAIN